MSETNCSTGESRQITSSSAAGKWRLAIAGGILFAGLLGLAVIEWVAWSRLERREAQFGNPARLAPHLGLEVSAHMQRISGALFRFQLSGLDAEREIFQTEARLLGELLAQARVLLSSTEELDLITQLQTAFQAYVAGTAELLERGVRGIRRDTPGQIHEQLAAKAQPVYALAARMGEVQAARLSRVIADVRADLANLRRARQMGVALVAVLALASGWWMHWAYVAPLRSALNQTQAVVQRQEKLASLGALAAGVAHEIRNPLMAIKFRLFSLKQSLGPKLAANEDFQIVHAEIDRLEKIVKSFLQFARPPEPHWAPVNSGHLFQGIAELLSPVLAGRNITLQMEPSEPITFLADQEQIQQVLINLVQNAADSIRDAGKITLRARHGAAKLFHKQEAVVILDVTDTGEGIPAEAENRLFDPFFSTKEGGAGLGLAIAARIIDRHGGLIQYSTQAGRGTTFSLLLPMQPRNPSPQNAC